MVYDADKTMTIKRLILTVLLPGILLHAAVAQEFNCRVQVNTQQIPGTDKAIYEQFRANVESFMNTQTWSNLQLTKNERLDCSLLFIFKTRNANEFNCDLQIQLQRPIYGASLMTTLLNVQEELRFEYQENQTLTFNPSGIDGNLVATLAFWSYVMLGLDSDSFSKLGGTPFYQKAQDIVSLCQGVFGDLWKAQEDKNHWGWVNALTSDNQEPIRVFSYDYHRRGLDIMHQSPDLGRLVITQSMNALKTVRQVRSGSPLLSNFIESKVEELINVYSVAEVQEKQQVYTLLNEVFPASSNRLQGIKNTR